MAVNLMAEKHMVLEAKVKHVRAKIRAALAGPKAPLLAALMLFASVTGAAQAQDDTPFTLFEPIESQESDSNPGSSRVTRREPTGNAGTPVFTLVGTSRIGEQRSAIVRHSSGVTVPVKLRHAGVTPIPGYEDYAIVGAAGSSLSVRYPGGQACVPFDSSGVRCSEEEGVALLSLTTAAPVEPEQPAAPPSASDDQNANPADEGETRNPFALLRERAENGELRTGDPDPNSRRFQPRRINPADVPPGKRIVSTPFGDRLVDI
ncbi:MAG: hypothetical protein PsegKO_00450 [Pseudohongiellaceae bacterium]